MSRARVVSILAALWVALAIVIVPLAARAGTLSADVNVYDWTSLGYACAMGLLGGLLALIVSLATDSRVVMKVLSEGGRNALVSPIAGGVAFVLIEAAHSQGFFTTTGMARFVVIVGAGWAGIAFFLWARDTASKGATALAEWVINRGKP